MTFEPPKPADTGEIEVIRDVDIRYVREDEFNVYRSNKEAIRQRVLAIERRNNDLRREIHKVKQQLGMTSEYTPPPLWEPRVNYPADRSFSRWFGGVLLALLILMVVLIARVR